MAQPQIRVIPAVKSTVVIVDDQSTSLAILEQVVKGIDANVQVESFESALDAIRWATNRVADLVLVDYHLPEMNGIELVRRLRLLTEYQQVPMVMITADEDRRVRYLALDAGVTDFMNKPIDTRECLARCRNLLTMRRQHLVLEDRRKLLEGMVREATEDVRAREQETLFRLARAGEFRDTETGNHIIRMARYSRLIANAIGMKSDEAQAVGLAAPLHDIGKIGIRDSILLKPARLTTDEMREMRQHPLIGYEILKDSVSSYVRLGALIALGHHEKFDGSGYPHGLVGDHIPLAARIVSVADVFDALTSVRPYKSAWSMEEAFAHLLGERCAHFDPQLVDAFIEAREETVKIYRELREPSDAAPERP